MLPYSEHTVTLFSGASVTNKSNLLGNLCQSNIGRPNGHAEFRAAPEGPLAKQVSLC